MDIEIQQTATVDHISARTEFHGDEKVPACDIDLSIKDIEAGELDQFALDGVMLSKMYWHQEKQDDLAGGYKLGGSKLGLVKPPLTIDTKLENYRVEINIESADKQLKKALDPVVINPSQVKKIKFTPKPNGYADLTLQVAGNLPGKDIGKIVDKYLNQRVSLTITPAENTQSDLLQDGEQSQDDQAA